MTKADWDLYIIYFGTFDYGIGDRVVVYWHWNFGTTRAKRERTFEGVLDLVDEKGVVISGANISYKSIDGIESLYDAYEPDVVLTPGGWRTI